MPTTNIEIPDTLETVTRPIVIGIVNRLKTYLNLPKDLEIIYPGELNSVIQTGSELGKEKQQVRFNEANRMMITVVEQVNRDQLLTMDSSRDNHPAIVSDNRLGLLIAPVYSTTDLKITIRSVFSSRTEANQWKASMIYMVNRLSELALLNISYHYLIPESVVRLVRTIHTLREQVEPYHQDFVDYLSENGKNNLTILSDTVGNRVNLSIAETQTRIVGYMEDTGYPEEINREDQGGVYAVEFNYIIRYEKPMSIYCRYPIMVHNQILPYEYVDHILKNDYSQFNGYYSRMEGPLAYFDQTLSMNGINNEIVYTINLPPEDQFIPKQLASGYIPLITMLCILEDNQPLLDLTNLPLVELLPELLEFIQLSDYEHITKVYGSILHLSLYEDDQLLPEGYLTVDRLARVHCTETLNKRHIYRVVLGLNPNPVGINENFFKRIMNYPRAMMLLMMLINHHLTTWPEFRNMWWENRFTDKELNDCYQWFIAANRHRPEYGTELNKYRYKIEPMKRLMFIPPEGYTVMASHILVHKLIDSYYDLERMHPIFQ